MNPLVANAIARAEGKSSLELGFEALELGGVPGHPFYGNQHTGGRGGADVRSTYSYKRDEDTESLNDAVNNAKGKNTSDVHLDVRDGKVVGYKEGGPKRGKAKQRAKAGKRLRDEETESLNDAVNKAKGKNTSDLMLNVKNGRVIGYK